MNKYKKYVFIVIILLVLSIWLIPFVKCETLTLLHGNEFKGQEEQTHMIADMGELKTKVLDYSNETARVYYVDSRGGSIVDLKKENDDWIMSAWDTVWSDMGSAGGMQWPYFWWWSP